MPVIAHINAHWELWQIYKNQADGWEISQLPQLPRGPHNTLLRYSWHGAAAALVLPSIVVSSSFAFFLDFLRHTSIQGGRRHICNAGVCNTVWPMVKVNIFQFFFQPRHGGTCPEPIPILYIVPGPSSSSELALLPHELSPPTTPYTSRAASRPSDHQESATKFGQKCRRLPTGLNYKWLPGITRQEGRFNQNQQVYAI